eukprot:364613-Chlamydomonas_euryale.AAC.7
MGEQLAFFMVDAAVTSVCFVGGRVPRPGETSGVDWWCERWRVRWCDACTSLCLVGAAVARMCFVDARVTRSRRPLTWPVSVLV